MRMKLLGIGAANAALIAAAALGPAANADDKPIPPPAPPVAGEPVYGAPDPGHQLGERLSALLTTADGSKSGTQLPSLANGVIGVTGDPVGGYTLTIGTNVPVTTILSVVTTGLGLDAQKLLSIRVGNVSTAALQDAWDKVNSQVRGVIGAQQSYWMDIDPTTQKVEVGIDPATTTDAQVSALTAIAPGLVEVERGGSTSRLVRTTADSAPHWGASYIQPQYDTSQYCSSGFSVIRNSNNQHASVTAGHCGTPGGNGGDFYSGSYFYGTKAGTANYPDYDQARLDGSTYVAWIRTNGGDDAETVRSVKGATDPVIGDPVCQSGVTSYAECNIIVGSLTAQACSPDGCTTALGSGRRADDTYVARPGDSGGPVYLRFSGQQAGIRGMVVAGGDGNTLGTAFKRVFFERYNSIANHLDVHILIY